MEEIIKKDTEKCFKDYQRIHNKYMTLGERMLVRDCSIYASERLELPYKTKDIEYGVENYIYTRKVCQSEELILRDYCEFLIDELLKIDHSESKLFVI